VLAGRAGPNGDVERLLGDYSRGLPRADVPAPTRPYRARFLLDEIGQPSVSAAITPFGGRVSGSIGAAFSDMLGDRQLGMFGQIGGTLADFGGAIEYVSRKHRWNWAASLSATPDSWGYLSGTVDASANTTITEYIERVNSWGPAVIAAYPFSGATRVEFAGDLRSVTLSEDTTTLLVDPAGRILNQSRQHVVIGGPFHLAEGRAALVHDTTFFGATSPIFGERYRIEAGRSLGSLSYTSWLADWRRYFMPKRPVTFGARLMHFGRYGRDAEQRNLSPVYLGYPELLHGYGVGSFSTAECAAPTPSARCAVFDNLIGSRMVVVNLEAHAPLVGLFRGDLTYGRVPIDVVAFMDAGVAWTQATLPAFLGGTRRVLRSAGGAARVNAFGLFVLEVSMARAFDRADRNWQLQIGIRQGF